MAELSDWGRDHIRMVLSWCLGFLGADRFYNGQVGLGVLKLLTLGGVGVWWLADAAYYTARAGEGLPRPRRYTTPEEYDRARRS